jgi:hypothetical protein
MGKVMKPFLVTTPRSGSTIVQALLTNLSMQKFGYKGNLHEPFTITELFKAKYERVNDVVQTTEYERVGEKWFDNKRDIKINFVNLIKDDHNYMMKLFPIDMEPEMLEMIENNYDVICLERSDKIHQALSWVLLWETNKAHYKIDDNQVISSVVYNSFHAREMLRHFKAYQEFKNSFKKPYKILVYEEFMSLGGDEDALIKLLNLPIDNYIKMKMETKPTPYLDYLETLIVNKEEWLRDKESLLTEIKKYSI